MRLRQGSTGWSRGRCAIAAGLVVALAGLAGACNSSPTETDPSSTAGAIEADWSILGDFTEGLGLTDDQIAALRDVLEEYRGQGRQRGTLWSAAADLQGILSSEQVDAIAARQAELGAEMKARREGMRGQMGKESGRHGRFGGRGEGLGRGGIYGDGLDLSDEQIAQMRQIRTSFAPQLDGIRDGVRSGSATRDEARARSDEIREAMHDALSGILTEEQLVVLEESRAEAEARREEMRSQWEGRRQAGQDEMVEALGLTVDQLAAIEALKERSGGEGRPSPEEAEARREEHHRALLDILDDDQEEIWILHGSLLQLFARHQAP
jgi:Spy/CpxP family protein refolding chaperone